MKFSASLAVTALARFTAVLALLPATTEIGVTQGTENLPKNGDFGPKPAVLTDVEVLIVGGGPAGLACASALARMRRNTLLVDSADYRNNYTRRIHDVLGFDGVQPAYFRWRAREQISEYETITMSNGTVNKIEPIHDSNFTYFSVTLNLTSTDITKVTARKVVLATGLRDIIPLTPGLAENWGRGIFWCPFCDGHEHADQAIGVLGNFSRSGDIPAEILSLNNDIIIFANGTDVPEIRAKWDKEIPGFDTWYKLHNVTVDNRTIKSVERLQDGGKDLDETSGKSASVPLNDLFRVNFETGNPVVRQAFITTWPVEQKSKLGEEVGVTLVNGRLTANLSAGMITNIPGIYAVGDANTDNSTNIAHAMWSGKRSAVSLHVALEKENAKSQVALANKKRSTVELNEKELWRRVNDGDELFNAGAFDKF